jgi:hypothetical protein
MLLLWLRRRQAMAGRQIGLFLLFAVLLCPVVAQSPQSSMQDPPKPQEPPHWNLCNFSGPLLHIPSACAGTEGTLVRVSPPALPRYPKGTPIAVHMFASRPECQRVVDMPQRGRVYRCWISLSWRAVPRFRRNGMEKWRISPAPYVGNCSGVRRVTG